MRRVSGLIRLLLFGIGWIVCLALRIVIAPFCFAVALFHVIYDWCAKYIQYVILVVAFVFIACDTFPEEHIIDSIIFYYACGFGFTRNGILIIVGCAAIGFVVKATLCFIKSMDMFYLAKLSEFLQDHLVSFTYFFSRKSSDAYDDLRYGNKDLKNLKQVMDFKASGNYFSFPENKEE